MNEILSHPVILFDGVCNLCSRSVQFIIRHDPKRQFRFASLQSQYGQGILLRYGLSRTQFNSFLLVEQGKVYTNSTGALRLTRYLNHGWPLLYGAIVIPLFIRDGIYRFIARNRYRWFGKTDQCWIPSAQLLDLFLDN